MSLRKIIREELANILNEESGNMIAAEQLIASIKSNGLEVIESTIEKDTHTAYALITAKGGTSFYTASLDIDYTIGKEGEYDPGFWGTPDTAVAPSSEPAQWSMKLDNVTVYKDGDEVYEGAEIFQDCFKNNYWEIHSELDDRIQEEY